MRHALTTNEMNKECMLEDLLMVGRTHEAYQVASEGDTCACMNYQANTKTIEDSAHFAMWRWSYGMP